MHHSHGNSPRRAFSLIELSIVLVILGLLVGGILAGQSLIRASELRAVTTEYNRWITATHGFRDKYFGLPGDIANATTIWGRQVNSLACPTNTSASVTTNGVCDGDGNGQLDYNLTYPSTGGEMHQYWRQLAIAGLIEGTFTGNPGGTDARRVIIGQNAPASRASNLGWGISWLGPQSGNATYFDGSYGNAMVFGAQHSTQLPRGEALRSDEAWNIDTKIDDGLPAQGKLTVVVWGNSCAIRTNGTTATNTSLTSVYNVSANDISCALIFRQVF